MVKLVTRTLILNLIVVGTLANRDIKRRQTVQTASQAYITAARADASPVELRVDTADLAARNATAPYLYGLMFEDINHSGDGGIYAELLANRAFQGSSVRYGTIPGVSGNSIVASENPKPPFGPVLHGWEGIGSVKLSLDALHPLSEALSTVMQVDIPLNATGEVGIKNHGWWGIDVHPQSYTASFYVLANAARQMASSKTVNFNISLRSNSTGEVWATSAAPSIEIPTLKFTQVVIDINNTRSAPNTNNTFAVTMDASQVAGQTLYFGLFSLFPETFKGRKNGLRKDIAEAFYDMKPKFLRFPGGNNLEGISVSSRWNWRKTIGPLLNRPGRPGDWNYYNTDGLGLLEYLEWCEDMQIEPVLAIYAGFSLDVYGQSGTSYPPDQMQTILQDALDELEYCTGDPLTTTYGSLRASHGHPKPFSIKFVEVGNEDWFSSTYPYRWEFLYSGLKTAHPDITFISTTYNENAKYTIALPPGTMWDTHHYAEPSYFLQNFNFYDNWQSSTNNTGVGVLLGEYSVYQIDTPSGVVNYSNPKNIHVRSPQLLSAIAEGVYALGGERNPNTVRMSSYAPSLENKNYVNWTPDMIRFGTAEYAETVLSASYWQQWMFARFRGSSTLPVVNTKGNFNPLFWAASIEEPGAVVYVKIINTGNVTVPLRIAFNTTYESVNGTILTAESLGAFNTVENKTAVVPRPVTDLPKKQRGNFLSWNVPKWSITILQFSLTLDEVHGSGAVVM